MTPTSTSLRSLSASSVSPSRIGGRVIKSGPSNTIRSDPSNLSGDQMKTKKERPGKGVQRESVCCEIAPAGGCRESGRPFTIQVAGERLHIPAGVTFNIEHEREGRREELEFQLKWQTAG
jgi:hypothetical protein